MLISKYQRYKFAYHSSIHISQSPTVKNELTIVYVVTNKKRLHLLKKKMNSTVFKILLVEDDQIERLKFERAINKLTTTFELLFANNGEEALAICSENKPNLIILDLNMPKMNGLEFLSALKKNELIRYIPVMILTTSDNELDKIKAYKLGIAGYVLKPLRYPAYVSNIETIINYWSMNELV